MINDTFTINKVYLCTSCGQSHAGQLATQCAVNPSLYTAVCPNTRQTLTLHDSDVNLPPS